MKRWCTFDVFSRNVDIERHVPLYIMYSYALNEIDKMVARMGLKIGKMNKLLLKIFDNENDNNEEKIETVFSVKH